MGIILWVIFGALVGSVASKLMGGGKGLLWDIIVGIVGAVIGGFNLYSFLVALLGACILVAIVKAVRR